MTKSTPIDGATALQEGTPQKIPATGSHVLHPFAGPCVVRGVTDIECVGPCLVLECVAPLNGRVGIPLRRVPAFQSLTKANAETVAREWEWRRPARTIWEQRMQRRWKALRAKRGSAAC